MNKEQKLAELIKMKNSLHYILQYKLTILLVYILFVGCSNESKFDKLQREFAREYHYCNWVVTDATFCESFYVYRIECKHGYHIDGNGAAIPECIGLSVGDTFNVRFIITK